MSFIGIAKLLISVITLLSIGAVASIFVIRPEWMGVVAYEDANAIVIIDNAITKNKTAKEKAIKCKVGDSTPFDCSIKKIDTSPYLSKKWMGVTEIKNGEFKTSIVEDYFLTKKVTYVIRMANKDSLAIKYNKDQRIKIISDMQNNRVFAKLKPNFGIDASNNWLGESQYFLAKANSTDSNTLPLKTEDKTFKCIFGQIKAVSDQACWINDFSENETSTFGETAIKIPMTSAETINKDKYYILKFDKFQSLKFAKGTNKIFLDIYDSKLEDANNQKIVHMEWTDLAPIFFHPKNTNEFAFILKRN